MHIFFTKYPANWQPTPSVIITSLLPPCDNTYPDLKTCPVDLDEIVELILPFLEAYTLNGWMTGFPHSANHFYTHVNCYCVFIFLLDIGILILKI